MGVNFIVRASPGRCLGITLVMFAPVKWLQAKGVPRQNAIRGQVFGHLLDGGGMQRWFVGSQNVCHRYAITLRGVSGVL
jgi:hypothetical protein